MSDYNFAAGLGQILGAICTLIVFMIILGIMIGVATGLACHTYINVLEMLRGDALTVEACF